MRFRTDPIQRNTYKIAKLALALFFITQFQIAPSVAAKSYFACANKKTGVIRLLNKGNCNTKIEKKISWNRVGPQGVAGAAGSAGAAGPAGVNGKDGVDGKNGLDGKNGVDGKTGNTILYGTSNPTSTIGVTGDFYINTATNVIFGPKTTSWPAGTSLVGPTGPGGVGPIGPIGPQGPVGVTGASTQVLWLTPQELLSIPPTTVGYTDTSSVVLLNFSNDGLWQPYYFEALELGYGKPRAVNFAIPKGWSGYKSLTFKVYWMTEETTTSNIKFEIMMNFIREGDDFSLSTRPNIYVMGLPSDIAEKPSPGPNIVNVITLNETADRLSGNPPRDGDLMLMTFRRPVAQNIFNGKVFVLGISVQANF